MLDLILSNEEGVIQNLAYHPCPRDSDLVSLTFDLTYHTDRNEKTRSQPNYFKANGGKIGENLRNIDWKEIIAGFFTDSYGLFVETMNRAFEGSFPVRVPRARKQSVYMNKDAIALKKKAKALEEIRFD